MAIAGYPQMNGLSLVALTLKLPKILPRGRTISDQSVAIMGDDFTKTVSYFHLIPLSHGRTWR